MVKISQGVLTQILQLKLKSTKGAEALHSGRLKHGYSTAGNHKKLRPQIGDNLRGRVAFPFALVRRLERSEDHARIRRSSAHTESGDSKGTSDIGTILENHLRAVADGSGVG